MALVKWEPRREMEPFRALRDEVDHLFEDFTRGWPRAFFSRTLPSLGGEFLPAVDLKESDDAFTLTADLPGIQKEDLDVKITGTTVTLKGHRKSEKEEKREGYHLQESSYGAFERVISLPAEVVAEKAKAKMKDGVLTLTLPKTQATKAKQIQIKVE